MNGSSMSDRRFCVPSDLVELDRWLLWSNEHQTKVPYCRTGRRASTIDPSTWCPYEEALEMWRRYPRRWAGIGFVLYEPDGLVGLDLDDSLDNDSNAKPWASRIVEQFADTYCEISPSGQGLKI